MLSQFAAQALKLLLLVSRVVQAANMSGNSVLVERTVVWFRLYWHYSVCVYGNSRFQSWNEQRPCLTNPRCFHLVEREGDAGYKMRRCGPGAGQY